ncbi:MAG: VOC family protein [Betaproteobacteria bacterium]|nr:VOC family protein [Betaproteobacteria bacterium]
MPELTHLRSVLAVRQLTMSVAFYRDSLGFTLEFETPGWAFMSRGAFAVMLGECPDEMPAGDTGDHSYFAYVNVTDIDTLYAEYQSKGVPMIQPLAEKPWGMREFGVLTPDGHRIMFGEELSA